MDLKNFTSAISQIAEEKGIPYEKVVGVIEQAYSAAYKKDYGQKGQLIKAKLSPKSGQIKFWQVKLVVDESMIYSEEELEELKTKAPGEVSAQVEAGEADKSPHLKLRCGDKPEKVRFNPEKHIMLDEAKKIDPKIKVDDELEMPLKSRQDYGRIAAQTAKQVILQRLKEAEREVVLEEYKTKEGEVLSGVVQRLEGRNVYLDIGKTLGLLPREEQVPGEFYKPGQRYKLYVLKVEETPKGPLVFLSRAYPKIISKLFEIEAPEVAQGSVVIRAIAREAGSRSKIAVESNDEKIDPIGSVVGQRGTRVGAVINEIGGEKIDIVEYSEDAEQFIANSLAPAKVLDVKIGSKNKALCLVPDDQLSLAIGKEGQNVRLAAKLTGWKIDVRSAEGEKEKGEKEKEAEAKEPEKEPEEKKEKKKEKKEEKAKEKPKVEKPKAKPKKKPEKKKVKGKEKKDEGKQKEEKTKGEKEKS